LRGILYRLLFGSVLAIGSAGVASAAASNCTELLLKHGAYRCSALLDTGAAVDYCFELRGIAAGPNGVLFRAASSAIGAGLGCFDPDGVETMAGFCKLS
jgi:hypothetical protein